MPRLTSPLAWVRRRDPALVGIRRAARVTLVACLGFYACRYGLDNPTMATYALFGAVAMGVLAQVPGTPLQRGRTLLAVLPVGYALVTAGTLLSVTTWSAAAGMLTFGFLVSYAGVGGPRLVGLANGVQLLYILPCFPPYDPGSLGYRLAGLTIAVLLLAAAELVLWPDPAPVPYPVLLAGALTAVAGCQEGLAGAYDGDPDGRDRTGRRLPGATEAAEAIRPSRLSPAQRPASAGRRDRALSHAGGLARLALGRTVDLYQEAGRPALSGDAVADLLRQTSSTTRAAAAWLGGDGPPPDDTRITRAVETFRRARLQAPPGRVDPDRLRAGSLALGLAEWTTELASAVRVAAKAPIRPDPTPPPARPEPLWYADQPAAQLWWRRFRDHLTPRSVYFQGALRLALALTGARVLAGVLDLSHGFWVLLATLTVLRTSALGTRSTLRPALVGTVVGSVLAGALLLAGADPRVYEVALPILMLVGFSAGPLLGVGWGQALFTLVISLVFAQLAPVNWQLAETRVVDVAVGATVGVLIGLLAWPRGGTGELHRTAGQFLHASGAAVRQSVAVLAAGAAPGAALPQARRQGQLATASYAQYQTEPHGPSKVDWQATLNAGHDAIAGADAMLRSHPTGQRLPATGPLTAYADAIAGEYERFGMALRNRDGVPRDPVPADPGRWPNGSGPDLYQLADLRTWLTALAAALARITTPATPRAAAAPADRRPSPLSQADPRDLRR
ncbi:FUSC family protein [Phytohabitans sp. ZYX-F-186]|uniref:FUSC family protein n=1 Tax=Phytohabitans maris TaxID=3071409 RepID=A0ABU0ZP81_9ACTN|nr:FUSC family protein [Phytohabitans sp. ZYX-F-186]MDQ7908045.1 FUSC family protein [Phytohabitans sp. ZYX-F-186]